MTEQDFLKFLEPIYIRVFLFSLLFLVLIKLIFRDKVHILAYTLKIMKAFFKYIHIIFIHIVLPTCIFLGKAFFTGIAKVFIFIFMRKKPEGDKGARFLDAKEVRRIMNPFEKGLLIDATEKRISSKLSFTHLLLVSSTGGGKTSKYIIPNVLTLAGDRKASSLVITDPSGEIFDKTSGYLKKQGYTIQVINPVHPQESLRYNPLAKVETVTDIGEIAHILVSSANPDAKDPFWGQGAETIIEIFIHCLKSLNKPEFLNLHNVLYLLQNFSNRQEIDSFVATHASQTVFNQYKGFIGGNPNTVASFLSTATTSLKMFNNTDICQIMSEDEISFEDMRKRKTALFIVIPSEKMSYYSFFLNIFYTQFFQAMMKPSQDKKSLPVYALMDEFANIGSIPSFTTILTTIRKHKVSLSLVVQDLSQLASLYGREEMNTILGNTASKLCYGGVSMQTAEYFENMIGKAKVHDTNTTSYREHNLIDAQQIRTLSEEKALFIISNNNPILLDNIYPYFENSKFKYKTQLKSYQFQRKSTFTGLNYVEL